MAMKTCTSSSAEVNQSTRFLNSTSMIPSTASRSAKDGWRRRETLPFQSSNTDSIFMLHSPMPKKSTSRDLRKMVERYLSPSLDLIKSSRSLIWRQLSQRSQTSPPRETRCTSSRALAFHLLTQDSSQLTRTTLSTTRTPTTTRWRSQWVSRRQMLSSRRRKSSTPSSRLKRFRKVMTGHKIRSTESVLSSSRELKVLCTSTQTVFTMQNSLQLWSNYMEISTRKPLWLMPSS